MRHHCVSDCLGRGQCDLGFCRCRPPYYGVDCSLSPPPAELWSKLPSGHLGMAHAARLPCVRPCVYIYELPARMNVLALKAEPEWCAGVSGYRRWRRVRAERRRREVGG